MAATIAVKPLIMQQIEPTAVTLSTQARLAVLAALAISPMAVNAGTIGRLWMLSKSLLSLVFTLFVPMDSAQSTGEQ